MILSESKRSSLLFCRSLLDIFPFSYDKKRKLGEKSAFDETIFEFFIPLTVDNWQPCLRIVYSESMRVI